MSRKKPPVKSSTPRKSFTDYTKILLPPFIGLVVILVLAGVFNSQLIAAKFKNTQPVLSQQETDNENQQLQSVQLDEDTQPTLRIAKIGIHAPVAFKNIAEDQDVFQELLQYGVVHYPHTALPGQRGNTVIFGHSSGQWWAPGDYKFVFSQLDKLEKSDKMFIDFDGKRFMYEVTDKRIVAANDVSVLEQNGGYNLTLITCYPVGSNAQRLIVVAKQVLPDPAATEIPVAPTDQTTPTQPSLPGATPSLWDAIKSAL